MTTDIKKTFLHVRFHEDRDCTCFSSLAYSSNPKSYLIVYHFKTVLFGGVSSPFILYATLYHHLQQHNTTFLTYIQTNLYVDYAILCRETGANIVHYYCDARAILGNGGPQSENLNVQDSAILCHCWGG